MVFQMFLSHTKAVDTAIQYVGCYLKKTGPLTACPRTLIICSSQKMISYIHKVRIALETRFSDESFYATS